jgi:hypothetical protein
MRIVLSLVLLLAGQVPVDGFLSLSIARDDLWTFRPAVFPRPPLLRL